MADVKISELTALTNPDGWEELVYAKSGSNWKINLNTVKNFVAPEVDDSMSDVSENPVQNKVVKSYVDWKTAIKSATAPENPTEWDLWYNTTDKKYYYYNWESWEEVWTWGGGWDFDPEWYYNKLHAWLADNLYTEDNTISIDVWNFRTTAGSVSVPSSWTASLNYIRWKSVRTVDRTEAVIDITATDGIFTSYNKYEVLNAVSNSTSTYVCTLTSWVWDTDPSTYGITATLQQAEFSIDNGSFTDDWTVFKTYVDTARGNFTMSYDTDNSERVLTNWTDTWSTADTTIFWITTPVSTDDVVTVVYYDECTDWTVTLDFTAEARWTIVTSNPASLLATWVNQYDMTTYVDNATINPSTWEIEAWVNKVAFVYAYGWVTNWYMWYSADWYIVRCWRCATLPDIWTILTRTWATESSTSCSMPFADTWYFCVEVSYDTDLNIHPKRSGQQDTNTDAYSTSTVTLPTEDVNSTSLPTDSYGMPSLGNTYDELNWQLQTYIKRVEVLSFSYSDLLNVANMWVQFDYDENYIYYVLWNPVTYDVSFTNTYTANDYWTEMILDSNDDLNPVAVEISTSYWSNLVDKLRTNVVTKEEYPQIIDKDTYDALPATKNTDWIIRFIFTEE